MDIEYLLILQKLRELSGGVLDSLMMRTTALGEQIITFLALSFIYWCVDKRAGRLMAFNVSVACTWNQYTKWKCRVERPWVRDARIVPVSAALSGAGGYSFPSGHTSRAAAVWGSLSAFLWTNASQKEKKAVPSDSGKLSVRRLLSLVCGLIVLAVAFSRNYLGVHTPQDVLAALLVGAAAIFLLEKVLRWADEGENRDLLVAGAGCALCFLPMLRAGCLSNAGAGMGFFLGWVIERRFVRFDTNLSWMERGVRFAVGGTGVVFLLTALSPALQLVMAGKDAGFFTSGFRFPCRLAPHVNLPCRKSQNSCKENRRHGKARPIPLSFAEEKGRADPGTEHSTGTGHHTAGTGPGSWNTTSCPSFVICTSSSI